MTPPGLELAPFGHLNSGDILGPGMGKPSKHHQKPRKIGVKPRENDEKSPVASMFLSCSW